MPGSRFLARKGLAVAAAVAVVAGVSPASSAPGPTWQSPLALGPTDAASISAADGVLLAAGRPFSVPEGLGRKEGPSPRRSGLFRSADGGASWTLAHELGPSGEALAPMATPQVVEVAPGGDRGYAAIGSTVWRSEDGGRTFRRAGTLAGEVRTLDALADGRLVAGLAGGGLHLSSDGGATWSPFGTGLPAAAVNQVLFLRDTILVATASGIYRSADRGTSFALSRNGIPTLTEVLGVTGDAKAGIFVAVPGNDIFTTTIYWSPDLGATWVARPPIYSKNLLPRLRPGALGLARPVAGRDGASLYAGTIAGLHVSELSATTGTEQVSVPGLTWEQIGSEPGSAAINALTVADVDPSARREDAVYAAVQRASVFIAGSGGERWASPGWYDLMDGGRTCAGLVARSGGRLVASCGRHVLGSNDGGATWNDPVGHGFPYLAAGIVASHGGLAVSSDGTVWINDYYSGLYRLPQGTGRWEKVAHPDPDVVFVVPHPTDPKVLYSSSLSSSGAVWRTEDGGQTWVPVLAAQAIVYEIAVSSNAPDRVLAATASKGSWLSADAGDTWTKVVSPGDGFHRAKFSEADPSLGYATQQDGTNWQLLRTRDGGRTWTVSGKIPSAVYPSLLPSPWDRDTVYVETQSGPAVTRDAGDSWQPFATGLPTWDENEILDDLVASPDEPGVIYTLAGLYGGNTENPMAQWVYRAVDPEVSG